MTIKYFNTKKKHKLSMYLSQHLKNKRYERINGVKYLSFTQKEARDALMIALKMALNKKDAKEFLSCLRDKMIIGYGASDASEKILKQLSKNTLQNKINILYFQHAKRKRQKLKTFTLLFFATL